MTTEEAFKHLIKQRAWYKDAGIEERNAVKMKERFKKGTLTKDTMENALKRSNKFKHIPEKWVLLKEGK